MKTTRTIFAVLTAFVLLPRDTLRAQFVRGHIYVSVSEPESCDFGGREWIVQIDPKTGEWSIFADSDDGICVVNGLRFTPDGSQLLAQNFGHYIDFLDGGWVQAFNPDGTSERILDASDGLRSPSGANALAFDRLENLYVVSGDTWQILRFPFNGGAPTVYADADDGIVFEGALDFAPNGDLFYGSARIHPIIRITSEGVGSVFDNPSGFHGSMNFDRAGNLFVGSGSVLYRYDNAEPGSRRILASGFQAAFAVPTRLALPPDGRVVYFFELFGIVYAIDAVDGETTILADVSDLSPFPVIPRGMTVYAPVLPGDRDADGDLDLADFAGIALCWTGSGGIPVEPDCRAVDIDGDNDIDLNDYNAIQSSITGP